MSRVLFSVCVCLVVVCNCVVGQKKLINIPFITMPDSLVLINATAPKNQLYMALAARRQHKDFAGINTPVGPVGDSTLMSLFDRESDITAYRWFNIETYRKTSFWIHDDKTNKPAFYHYNLLCNSHEKVIIVGIIVYTSAKKAGQLIFIDEGADGTLDGAIWGDKEVVIKFTEEHDPVSPSVSNFYTTALNILKEFSTSSKKSKDTK